MDNNTSRVGATEIKGAEKICSVAFTADGKHLVGGDERGVIRRWKIHEGSDTQQVGAGMSAAGQVTTIDVSKDAQWIVTGDWGGKVIVWNATTHQKALEITKCQYWVWAVDITSDSTRIAVGSGEKSARVFNITTGIQLIPPLNHDSTVIGLKFSPSGDRIATATYDRPSVRIYNSHTGDQLFDIPVRVRVYPTTPLTWSPDGQQLFAVSPRMMYCIDTSTSARSDWPIHNKDLHVSVVTNGKFLACSAGTSVSFWDAVSHKQIGCILDHDTDVECIALSPDEEYLACGNGNKISFHKLSEVLRIQYLSPSASRPLLMEVSSSAIKSWKEDDANRTEAILSAEIGESNSNHHALANRALIRARSKQWSAAIEDSNMSLQIKPSPMGHIAKALALVGMGDKNLGLSEFDFAFSACDLSDANLLLVIKSIVVFRSGNHDDAIFRVNGLLANADEATRYYCIQVLGNMYLKKGDYEGAIRALHDAPCRTTSNESPHLTTISLIFGWNFGRIEPTAWTRLCETFYASGRIKEVGETLIKMVNSLAEDEREATHCRILEEIVTRSGDVALLSWTGRPSAYNSCLPASPAVYAQTLYTPPTLEAEEMEARTAELRTSFLQIDALIIYHWITRLQPVRFTNRHLHLPCLPFRVQSLTKDEENTYRAKVTWLGDVEFTTDDTLPLNASRRLVFVHPWIRRFSGSGGMVTLEDECESDADVGMNSNAASDSASDAGLDTQIVHASRHESLVQDASLTPLDTYTRALRLIARLGQPFDALLLLKQSDGTYKRIAAEHEIVVPGLGRNIPKDIRAEVLEVV